MVWGVFGCFGWFLVHFRRLLLPVTNLGLQVQLERLAVDNAEAQKQLRVASAELERVGRQLADCEAAELARIARADRAERAAATIPAPPQFPALPPAGPPLTHPLGQLSQLSQPQWLYEPGAMPQLCMTHPNCPRDPLPGPGVGEHGYAESYAQLGHVDPLRALRTRSLRETMREMDTIFAVAEARLHAPPQPAPAHPQPPPSPSAPAAPTAVGV